MKDSNHTGSHAEPGCDALVQRKRFINHLLHKRGGWLPWHMPRAVLSEQCFIVFYAAGQRQAFQYTPQPSIGLMAVGFGGFH